MSRAVSHDASAGRSGVWPRIHAAWFSNPRADLLSGLVVALALIPEALSFSIIAGVDPEVGIYAACCIAITIAFAGGRPAMISGATGSVALVMVPLVADHGVGYMLAATLLTGVFQILFGLVGIHKLMRFVPRTVMLGFVNALAILLFLAQLPHLTDGGFAVYWLVALGLAIIYLLPKLTKAVPSPLVAIIVVTVIAVATGMGIPTVGDMGQLPHALPTPGFPMVPLNFETLRIIAPYALTMAIVALLESLLTTQLVDDVTDTRSNKAREVRGQGIANLVAGAFGGMAGCAMIGQTMVNMKSGGRTRLSTLASGVFLLLLAIVLDDVVAMIPMAALVAVMIFVSISTFNWRSVSIRAWRDRPKSESLVIVVTVAVVVATGNLAIGVVTGVVLSALFFARRVAHMIDVSSVLDPDGRIRVYAVTGQLFFASTNELPPAFDYDDDVDKVVIDLTDAHVWDTSAVAALDGVRMKFADRDIDVEIIGLTGHSARLHDKVSGRLAGAH